jgi:hypothetical protein
MAPCHCEGTKGSRAEKKQGGPGVLYILLRLPLGWEMKIMGSCNGDSCSSQNLVVVWHVTRSPRIAGALPLFLALLLSRPPLRYRIQESSRVIGACTFPSCNHVP